MFDHILVPLDGSHGSEYTLPHTLFLARTFHAQVQLLQVLDRPRCDEAGLSPDTVEWDLRRAQAETYLEEQARVLRGQGMTVSCRVTEGRTADQIVEALVAWPAHLLVLDSHGRGEAHRFCWGSVAGKLLQQASHSLLLVPARTAPRGDLMAPAPYRRIAVPLDGSQRAGAALGVASALARSCGAELLLLHVVPIPEMLTHNIPLDAMDQDLSDRVVARNRRVAEHYLKNTAQIAMGTDLHVRIRMESASQVGQALGRMIEEEQADLVVLNAHGSGCATEQFGRSGAAHGSVARHLLMTTRVPALVFQDLCPLPRSAPQTCEEARLPRAMRRDTFQ